MSTKPINDQARAVPRTERRSGVEDTPERTVAPGKLQVRARLRERFEALSLAEQLRAVIVLSVVAATLTVQTVSAFSAAWRARDQAVQFAVRLSSRLGSESARDSQSRVADAVAGRPDVNTIVIVGPDGEMLARYASSGVTDADIDAAAAPPGWLRRVGGALGLVATVVAVPVDGAPDTRMMIVSLGPGAFWGAAGSQLLVLLLTLPLGLLIAMPAARSLKSYVVDPLAQLATTTRVGNWSGGAEQADAGQPRNELTEIASNFDVLAVRLAEYERDLRNLRVTSSRQIAEQTRKSEQRVRDADALMRAKDEFLANMSHEIRTPMNGVLGMAELLASTNLDRRQQRFVDGMRTAAGTMMQIINEILDDSKIKAGKMDLVCEPLDVRTLMEDVGELYAGAAEQKKLEMICRIEHGVPAAVVGDVLRLKQVLGNLVSNAVKYTDAGEITIRVASDPDLHDGKRRLHFSVVDTGPGIPPDKQATIFDAFTQLENAARVGGTGLGLSIANQLVKLMGGERIDVHSESGRGSTFSFALPFALAPATGSATDVQPEFEGMRVLLVDDNSASYMQLEEMLQAWSAEVTVANRARVMLDRLRSAAQRGPRFDLVLIDHSLPDMSSGEILRAIRRDPLVRSTYVVLLTALDFDLDQDADGAVEPDACVPKPVRRDLLGRALRAARDPRSDSAGMPSARTRSIPVEMLGLDVLVADDNAINREVAVAMLEQRGCKVEVAEDGRAAVTLTQSRRFDVVLMDCQMPGMDGYAAASAIRRQEQVRGGAPMLIVALTANVLARDRDRCAAAGMNAFLSKPFSATQLVDILRPIALERGTLRTVAAAPPVPARAEASAPPVKPGQDGLSAPELLTETAVFDMLEVPLFAPAPTEKPRPASVGAGLAVLDREQVAAVRGLGRPEVFEKLCQLLFKTAPAALGAIRQALDAGDLEAAASVAHSLKSSCANLGGRQVAAQLERCESTVRESGDLEQVRAAAVGLEQRYAALAAALTAELARPTGTA